MDINKCIDYAGQKHFGQKRKDGSPYINHPLSVALALKEKGYGSEYQITGLFHDLLEDTDATEKEILELSNESVLEAVKLLTKTPENKKDYIRDILKNPIAKAVKNEDRIHNLKDAIKGIDRDPEFAKRYAQNTKEYYIGKFSKELDQVYEDLTSSLNPESYDYIIDGSIERDITPIYRTKDNLAWMYDRKNKNWVETDPDFWIKLCDNAFCITYTETREIIKSI